MNLLALLFACPAADGEKSPPADSSAEVIDSGDSGDTAPPLPADTDGDGTPDEDDCAPGNATISPSAIESCNGVDDDCDGDVDEGVLVATYADADGDGHGDASVPLDACPGTVGTSDVADDCDDAEPLAYPGNAETCDNGIDDDCDGDTTECRYSGSYDLDDVGHWIDAETDTDQAGESIAALGDIDGDGIDDFVVGAPGHGVVEDDYRDRGALYIVRGSSSGLIDNLGDAWAIVDGVDSEGEVGARLAPLGDIDGDGLADVAVSAVDKEVSDTSNEAGIFLLRGIAGGIHDVRGIGASVWGTESLDSLFMLAAFAADVTGDGGGDVLVTGYSSDRDGYDILACPADLPDGSTADDCASLLYSAAGEERKGIGADGSTDLDGDGIVDLAVSDVTDCSVTGNCVSLSNANGAVRVYSGPVTGTLGWDDWSAELLGEAEGHLATMEWPSVGDTNGDGYADLAVAAPNWEDPGTGESGAVYIVLGPISASNSLGDASARVVGDAGGGGAAYTDGSTPGVGDVDGDGRDDIVIGSRLDALGDLPALHVLYGPIIGGAVIGAGPAFTSTRDNAYPGVHAIGDVNGDGLADAAMGVPGYEWSADWPDVPAGGLHVLLGRGI